MDVTQPKPDRRHRPVVPLTPAQRALCESFANQFPNLIGILITRYPGTYHWATASGLDLEEIRQLGWLGVIHAAKKFVPGTVSKGRVVQFATYALPWIRQAVARPMIDRRRQMRTPANDGKVCSLSAAGLSADVKAAEPFRIVAANETSDRLAEALMRLPERERKVVTRRYGFDSTDGAAETLDAIATDLRLTKERVRQIQIETVQRLRQDLESGVPLHATANCEAA